MSKKKRNLPDKIRPSQADDKTQRQTKVAAPEVRDQLLLEAVLAYQSSRFSAAEDLCKQLLVLEPRFSPAMQLLGMSAARTGRVDYGIKLLREVVASDPQSVVARNELASLLRKDGRASEAIPLYQQVIHLKRDDAGAYNNLGLSYLAERRVSEAVASFERGLAIKSDLAILHYNMGVALQLQSRDGEAAASYRRAIALEPTLAEARIKLGQLLLMQGEHDEAIASFRSAIQAQSESVERCLQLARLLSEIGQPALAEECLRQAIALDPKACDAYEELGNVLKELGRFGEAITQFGQAIDLQPARSNPYLGIVSCKKLTEADHPLTERMKVLLHDKSISEQDSVNLHYALGKASDDMAEYKDAMHHFDEANRIAAIRLRRSGRVIDRKKHEENIDRLITTFTPEFFSRNAALGSQSELPIFIVGMIRSGTTLVEQIVSSHPEVGAGGELRFWGDRAALVGDVAIDAVDSTVADRLAEDYCRLLYGLAPASLRVTDKMPTNFLLLGIIHMIFPRARIIHCRRDPVDNCLSIYFTPYVRSPDYAHDRSDIVFYYEQYARLMAHWRRVLPADRFLEVNYEDLVADRETIMRRIITFCGLDWDEACLQHEHNERAIKTPSQWQARQPVYRSSIQRWQHYDEWLREFSRLRASPALL